MTIARVRDGQLVEGWNAIDFLAMYQQIGWVTHPVAPVCGGRQSARGGRAEYRMAVW